MYFQWGHHMSMHAIRRDGACFQWGQHIGLRGVDLSAHATLQQGVRDGERPGKWEAQTGAQTGAQTSRSAAACPLCVLSTLTLVCARRPNGVNVSSASLPPVVVERGFRRRCASVTVKPPCDRGSVERGDRRSHRCAHEHRRCDLRAPAAGVHTGACQSGQIPFNSQRVPCADSAALLVGVFEVWRMAVKMYPESYKSLEI